MKVQGNLQQKYSAKNLAGLNAAKTSFKGYVPRNYTKFRGLEDAIFENSGGMTKMLMNLQKKTGENLNNIVTAVGTAAVAPIFITFNPFSKEEKDSRAYTAWRQPISAIIALAVQLLITTNYNKLLDNHAAFKNIEGMDLSAKPPVSAISGRAKQEYKAYYVDCLKKGIEPEKKSKWVDARVRTIQDEAFYNELERLRKTLDITKLKDEELVKISLLGDKREECYKDVLKRNFNFTDDELKDIKSFDQFAKKKGKDLAKARNFDLDLMLKNIDTEAMVKAKEEILANINAEAEVKRLTSSYKRDMLTKVNGQINGFTSAADKSRIKENIFTDKYNELKTEYEGILAKAENLRTAEENYKLIAFEKFKEAKSIDNLKDHGKDIKDVIRSVKIKKYLINNINKSEIRLKNWRDRSGMLLNLAILPFTCGLLNWTYPKIMKKFFPELSAAKEEAKAKQYEEIKNLGTKPQVEKEVK